MVFGLGTTATKALIVFLSAATVGFLIATIVLAVEYNDIKSSTDTTTTTAPPTTPIPPVPKFDYRLSGNIIPSAYRLSLDTDETYNRVEIDFETLEDTNEIILHARNMDFVFVNVFRKADFGTTGIDHLVEVDSYKLYPEEEFFVVRTKQLLNAGRKYYIKITYRKIASDTRKIGAYRENQMFVSNFKPTYARYAFPCFDEPSYKTKYTITVSFPSTSNIVSNMMIKNSTENPTTGRTEVTFDDSLPMSTYQVGLFISEFGSKKVTVQPSVGQSIELAIHAAKDDLEMTSYALELTDKILKYFVDYFDVEYPLTKLDMVAIPGYPKMGGGGLGILLLDSKTLIFDDQNESFEAKENFAINLARELTQLWVGDMVTQKWWNDMWLYNGLSTYLAYQALDNIYPDWGVLNDFLINELHPALDYESMLTADPLAGKVESNAAILSKFTDFSVKKSASIVRMYASKVGVDNFHTACKQFLKNAINGYLPAYTFMDELATLAGQNEVTYSSDMFIRLDGVPVLDVEKRPQENATVFYLYQNSTRTTLWFVPVSYIYENSAAISQNWLSDIPGGHMIAINKELTWMKFNVDQRGYYRIRYDTECWDALLAAMEGDQHEQLSIADRAGLLNDALSLSYLMTLDPEISLNMIKTLQKDLTPVPWHVGSKALMKMKAAFQEAIYGAELQLFVQKIIKDAYNFVGWTPDTNVLKNKLRMLVLNTACKFQYDPCLNEAQKYFDQWNYIAEKRPHPDIRQLVYSVGIASMTDEAKWNEAFGKMILEMNIVEKEILAKALAQTKSTEIVQKYLTLTNTTELVSPSLYLIILRAIADNPVGMPIVWRYFQDNWNSLTSIYGRNNPELNGLLVFVTSKLYTDVRLSEVTQFLYNHNYISDEIYREVLVGVALNHEWLRTKGDAIGMWLQTNSV